MDDYFRYMYNGKEADERMMNSRYEEGMEKGIERGKEVGSNQEKIEIARSMLKDNIPVEVISKYTNLEVAEIKKLID